MIGTIVNTLSIVFGGSLGIFLKDKFPKNIQNIVMQGISLAVIILGIQMALVAKGTVEFLLVIFSLIIGGIVGELLKIEIRLDKIGNYLKNKFGNGNDLFVQGFVQASLIYCVGAMAILGSIQDGLKNDPSILLTKSLLDGISSIAFAATFGLGVVFAAIPVFVYQGSITLIAAWAEKFLQDPIINEMTATGGILVMAIGFNVLKITKIKIGNLLPSIFIVIILASIVF